MFFTVQIPRNFKIVAVPLFDLYENSSRFGAILASLPGLISRFRLTLAGALPSAEAEVEAKDQETHVMATTDQSTPVAE